MYFRGRRLLGWIVLVIGFLFFLESSFPRFSAWRFIGNLWPLTLVFLGLYIMVNRGRFSGSISGAREEFQSRFMGALRVGYDGREIGDSGVSLFAGELTLDLAGSRLAAGQNNLQASFGFGDVTVHIPADFPVRVMARAIIGELGFDRERSGGFLPKIDHSDNNYQSSASRLLISVDGFIGELKVQRIQG